MTRSSTSRQQRSRQDHESEARRPIEALDEIEASIDAAWADHREAFPRIADGVIARRIVDQPQLHSWRLVDAALDRLRCPNCGDALGRGPRGCGPCDLADGFRFGAREPDRPGVPAGNEHALRVSTAVLRAPHRYPAWAVAANRTHLPLFLAGQLPTRVQQEALLAASRAGVAVPTDGVKTFEELAARALVARAHRP